MYAEGKKLMSQTLKMLLSSLNSPKEALITPLLLLNLQLCVVSTKGSHLFEYSAIKCLNRFVQSLKQQSQIGEDPNCSVTLGQRSCYRIIPLLIKTGSQTTYYNITPYLSGEKTQCARRNCFFTKAKIW